MFTESAELYDAIYAQLKDYAHEVDQIAALVRSVHPSAHAILDVGCGTGEHARRLVDAHGFAVDGLDLDPTLLDVAQRKHPAGRFVVGDMAQFALGRRYDAVLCLFSAIGYLGTLDRIEDALACFRAHLADDGILVVEPWFPPEVLDPARVSRVAADVGNLHVERISRTEIIGRMSHLYFTYHLTGPEGMQILTERHDLGLFTSEEMLGAFRRTGLAVDYDPVGLAGRGLYVARRAA